MDLRPRQIQAIADTREAFLSGARAPILVAPTGFGKTTVATEIMRLVLEKGGFLDLPRREIGRAHV